VPVVFGTMLRAGDLLRVSETSHAQIVCSDLTLQDLQVGVTGVPCVTSRAVLRKAEGSLINATRGGPKTSSFPMILSPRKTKLLSRHPLLRWTPVEGATEYRIAVRGPNLFWPAQISDTTEFQYPETAPELSPGVDYKLIVETSGRSSSLEPGNGLGFSILPSKERRIVQKEEAQIESLSLAKGPTQFLIAYLYKTHGLRAEAIEKLEEISSSFHQAAVRRLLGDLYMDIGLARQAETHYLTALDLSRNEKDEEGQIWCHLALAGIYQFMGNRSMAVQHLDAARDLGIKIGDTQTANEASKRLAELAKSAS